MFRKVIIGTALLAVVFFGWRQTRGDEYELQVLMPSADGTFVGAKVMIAGERAGTIKDVAVRDNKALVTVSVDDAHAPLHAGTTARVSWESVVGNRVLEIIPGAVKNADLRSGQRIESSYERVEIDDVLATLDAPTRKYLRTMIDQLNATLAGNEKNINETLTTAGPTLQALGEILGAVGKDGPAIKDLVTRLHTMTSVLASRSDDVAGTVNNLGALTRSTASAAKPLNDTLAELPSTLAATQETLDKIPGAVEQTVPVLKDITPATARLPRVAANLSPLLANLGPTLDDLAPTLQSAQALMQYAPALLDSAHETLPGIEEAVTTLMPAVSFLRPYTPEVTGWITNWTGIFAGSKIAGNYARALITTGTTAFNDNPGILPPGINRDPRPAPGSISGQPWVDANGDDVR